MRRSKALVVSYGGGHAAIAAPVVRELRRRGRLEVVALALTTAAVTYNRLGVHCRGFADYMDPDRDADALALGERLKKDVLGSATGVPEKESIAYLGLCFKDLIDRVGEEEAWRLYRERGRHAFLPRGPLRRIIEIETPTVIVTTNSPKSERAAILEGNAAGIPTLMVPDMFCSREWEMYAPFEARYYAVISELAVKNLMSVHRAEPDRIEVTGQPAFDKSAVPSVEECRSYARAECGVELGRFILAATTLDPPDPHTLRTTGATESRRALAEVLTWCRSRGAPTLVVKPHPSESQATYAERTAGQAGVYVASPQSDLNRWLRASSGMLALGLTTSILDALSLDVPTAAVRLTSRPDALQLDDLGVPVARAETEIAPLAETLMSERFAQAARQAACRRELATQNARAIGNVAEVIERLAVGEKTVDYARRSR